MASFESSIPPSTLCSAATSCGGVRPKSSRGPLELLSSSARDTAAPSVVESRHGRSGSNTCLTAATDTARDGGRPAPVPTTVGAGGGAFKHRCGPPSGQPGDNRGTSRAGCPQPVDEAVDNFGPSRGNPPLTGSD